MRRTLTPFFSTVVSIPGTTDGGMLYPCCPLLVRFTNTQMADQLRPCGFDHHNVGDKSTV